MPDKPVICRLNRDTIFGALFIGGWFVCLPLFGYFIQPPPKTQTLSLTIILTLAILAVVSIPILWIWWRCRIIADKTSLEIRGIFYRRVIPWNSIHDYYLELASAAGNRPSVGVMCIEYSARKFKFNFIFTNMAELREAIENYATDARAQKFDIKEKLDVIETPQVFEYGNPQLWPIMLLTAALFLLVMLVPYINSFSNGGIAAVNAYFVGYTLKMKLGLLAISFCHAAVYALLGLAHIPRIKKIQEFAGQKIIVSKSGLAWQCGADKTEIPWSQIERYYVESLPGSFKGKLCVVEGARERITFLYGIPKGIALRHLITQNSSTASTTSWQYALGHDSDLLGPPAKLTGEGKIIFHYKNRTNRAMLVFVSTFCLAFIASTVITGPKLANLIPLAITGIPTFYGWLAYFFAQVEINRDGIQHNTLIGKKFIAWNQVKNLKNASFYSIESATGTMRISQMLSENNIFKEAIEERTGKIWERPAYENQYRLGR